MTQEPGAELLVDVVIPVLNEAHVLAKSIAIVRGFLDNAVTWRWRVIVDNGSTDGIDDVGRQVQPPAFSVVPRSRRLQAHRSLTSTRNPASHAWPHSS